MLWKQELGNTMQNQQLRHTMIIMIWKKKKEPTKHPSLIKALRKITSQDTRFKKMVPYLDKDRRLYRLIYHLEGEARSDFKEVKKEILLNVKNLSKPSFKKE